MSKAFLDETRAVVRVTGPDAETFLQGLVSNDVKHATATQAVYAAMLTPQGKYLFDMLIARPTDETFLLDVQAERAPALVKRLSMYKLRADVSIEIAPDWRVVIWIGAEAPNGADQDAISFVDPRHSDLGLRILTTKPAKILDGATAADPVAYADLRIRLGVPASSVDLVPDETFLLDADFERLNGVDFKKGCYVGQEVTARMKHKTERKKRLFHLNIEGAAPASGTDVLADGKPAGKLGSVSAGAGLAILRADRVAEGALVAEQAKLQARLFGEES